MDNIKAAKKSKYSVIVFTATFLSFVAIVLFVVCFAFFAPGNYPLDSGGSSAPTAADVVFAVLLLVNIICALLSLIEVVRTIVEIIRLKEFKPKYLLNFVLGLYPIILLLSVSSFNLSTFTHFLMSPFRILF